MRKLELKEHTLSPAERLSSDELNSLRLAVPSIAVTAIQGRRDRFDLKPGSVVGTITMDGLEVRIVPKLAIHRLLFLLAYSSDSKHWRARLSSFGTTDDYVEAIAWGFAHHVQQIQRGGLLQGYRVRDEALPGLRGRLRIEDQLRQRHGRLPPVEVRYDDFTYDILENRLLKAALLRLRRLGLRAQRLARKLNILGQAFGAVTAPRFSPGRLPEVTYTRLNARYRPAIQLASQILHDSSLDITGANLKSRSFLIDMNSLFEDFVVVALREALGLSSHSFPRGAVGRRLTLDQTARVRLWPDLSWWQGNQCLFVGDAKYKIDNRGQGKPGDLYQLLSYAVAANVPKALLIYASCGEQPVQHDVRHCGKVLEIAALDLDTSPPEVLKQIAGLAEQIRRMKTASAIPTDVVAEALIS